MNTPPKRTHRQWRKDAKKFRRKRIRRKLAVERDRKAEEIRAKLVSDPIYQSWLQDQEELETYRSEMEQREHDEQDELWMRRELLAQKRFCEEQKRKKEIEEAKEKERQRIQKEFEEQQKIIQDRIAEKKRIAEEHRKRHELLLQKIEEYINGEGELPPELYESADTNPGKDLCPFFLKTAACRYGDNCIRNHSRPGVSRILLLPHFFTHIRLNQSANSEYGCDLALEYSETELYFAYEEFFKDVTAELSKYGEIVNFRTCKNTLAHLRGNVLIEFKDERSSLKAYKRLLGRYYACRRINVEFCKLVSWKAAICGLSLLGKCPKGSKCNYMHTFKNPGNKYNVKDTPSERSSSRRNLGEQNAYKPTPSWNEDNVPSRRNWRWSESPEPDTKDESSHSDKDRSRNSSPRGRSKKLVESKSPYHKSRKRSRSSSPRRNSRNRTRSRGPSRRTDERVRSRSRKRQPRSRSPNKRSRSRKRQSRSRSPNKVGRSIPKDSIEPRQSESNESNKRSRSQSKERKKRKRRKRSKSKCRKNNK